MFKIGNKYIDLSQVESVEYSYCYLRRGHSERSHVVFINMRSGDHHQISNKSEDSAMKLISEITK